MINVTLLLAALLFWLPRRLFARGSLQQACFLTVHLGFAFWYWLPAVQMLNFPPGETLALINVTRAMLDRAAWVVLLYETVAILMLVLARPLIDNRAFDGLGNRDATVMAAILFVSSLSVMFVRFGGEGIGTIRDIFTGVISARDLLPYYNRAASAGEALLTLWDVLNVAGACFVVALAVLGGRTLSLANLLAVGALVISFFASGSRSVLLGALVAALVARSVRGALGSLLEQRNRSRFRLFYTAALALTAGSALYGIGARFRFGAGAQANYISDTVINDNDMFRETAFVIANLGDYQPVDKVAAVSDFLLTPFWYMFPSFLGFSKDIPEHLVYFNYVRAGIDIINGQGNVFPGLIGDCQLVFGLLGPLLFGLFITLTCVALSLFASRIRGSTVRLAYATMILSFLFVSFRNIQGSLVLLFCAGWAMAFLLGQRADVDPAPGD